MKKTFTSCSSRFSRLWLLLAVAILGASAASAADPIDLGELELGKGYEIEAYKSYKAKFTPPADGTLKVVNRLLYLFSDEACASEIQGEYKGYQNGGQAYEYSVTASTTIYFYNRFAMNGGTMTLYMDNVAKEPLEISWITPDPGSAFNMANYSDITVKFNREVDFSSLIVEVEKSDATKDSRTFTPSRLNDGSYVIRKVADYFTSLINGGIAAPGAKVSVGMEIKDGDEAVAEIEGYPAAEVAGKTLPSFSYSMGSVPAVKVSEKIPAKIYSYYLPGDENAILSMTFDKPLSIGKGTTFTLGYGNLEGEDGAYYYEELPVALSEDKLTIQADLSGKLRTPQTMTPNFASTKYSSIDLRLVGVVDQYGNPVKSEGLGTIGSYSWAPAYEEIERTVIGAEFTPDNGGSLAGVDNIEVYLSPTSKFSFSGFNFTYSDGDAFKSVVIAKDKATISEESTTNGGSAVYTFAVPAEVKGKSNITVTLADLICADGYDHNDDIKAQYDTFVITYADPANGSTLASFGKGDTFTIKTNYTEKYPEMYIVYEIQDMNPDEGKDAIVRTESWFTRQADGKYVATPYGNAKLYAGHTYHVNFTAWASENDKNYRQPAIGTAYITWNGATPPYIYSDLELSDISPEPESVLSAEDRVITLTFNGLVTMNSETTFINVGMGATAAFESITPVNSEDGQYSDVWQLTVSESFLASLTSYLDISFVATDMNGRRIKGNMGEEENTYFYYTFDYEGAYAEYTLSVDGGEAPFSKVSAFKAASDKGIGFSGNCAADEAYVMDRSREIVAKVSSVSDPVAELGQLNPYLTLTLDNEITTPGVYILIVPANYFTIGEEFSAQKSMAMNFDFEVNGGTQAPEIVLTPAEGDVTELPERIEMLVTNYSEFGLGSGVPSLTINDGEPVKLADIELDMELWNKGYILLPQSYTEAGKYVISFPEGMLMLGAEGVASPALSFTYNIVAKPTLNLTVDPAEGEVKGLKDIQITFNDYEEISLSSGKITFTFTPTSGEPVVKKLDDAELDWDIWNKAIVKLGGTYTEAGSYNLSFPAGYFNLDSDISPAFELNWTISGSSAIDDIEVSENEPVNVYNLQGIEVLRNADSVALKSLTPGIYIVNGQKVIVK